MWKAQVWEQLNPGNKLLCKIILFPTFNLISLGLHLHESHRILQDELQRVLGAEAVANLEQNAAGSKDGEGKN